MYWVKKSIGSILWFAHCTEAVFILMVHYWRFHCSIIILQMIMHASIQALAQQLIYLVTDNYIQSRLQPIHMAAKTGHNNIIDTLINDYGVSPNVEVCALASTHNSHQCTLFMNQADGGQQCIHAAAGCGQPGVISNLITNHGVDPKAKQLVESVLCLSQQ